VSAVQIRPCPLHKAIKAKDLQILGFFRFWNKSALAPICTKNWLIRLMSR
jgi:hypothetical protein